MARSFLLTDREELIFGEPTKKLIAIVPDVCSVTVGEPSTDIEFDSVRSTANKRAKVSSTCLICFVTASLGSPEFVDGCFVSVVHPFFKSNDSCFCILEPLQFE